MQARATVVRLRGGARSGTSRPLEHVKTCENRPQTEMFVLPVVCADEDGQRRPGAVPERWGGPSRCGEDHALCALGVLDR